ncbi:MAG: porin family protein [Methylococcaceae bacterium]|nr:porin family protein [Methylococcaceae bacterium]
MIKKTRLALSAATAVLAFTGLTAAPQVLADELSDLKSRIAKLEQADAEQIASSKDNMVFFRGGYARNNIARRGILAGGDVTLGPTYEAEKDGWYLGAGFDFSLSDDLFGLHDGTEILAELMFNYSEFDTSPTSTLNSLNAVYGSGVLPAGALNEIATVSQFTLTASPKVKFLKGSDFRPWIIPIGLGLHVISPTSNGITYLKPAMQFAAGADYRVWNDIYLGADFRYNLGFESVPDREIDIDGFTTGAYVGIGF